MDPAYQFIGKGLYSVAEARRLTRVPGPTLARWVKGYARRRKGERKDYAPILDASLPKLEGQIALSFRDLVELRFVNRLRELKVSWFEIKATIDRAREILQTPYPFGTYRFATDGRRLFSEIIDKPGFLLRIRTNQITADRLFSPDLYAEIEFEHGDAVRWRPEAGKSLVVIDPGRVFGKPIFDKYGIPTSLVKKMWEAEESIQRAADWFEISDESAEAAVAFELKIAA